MLFRTVTDNVYNYNNITQYFLGEHGKAFMTDNFGYYRPFVSFFFYVHYKLFGADSIPLHISSLILFISASFLLFNVVYIILKSKLTALFAVFNFILYPSVVVHSAYAAADSGEIISIFFILLSIYIYQKNINTFFCISSVFCSFFSKEISYTLPAILFGYEILINNSTIKNAFRKNFFLILFSLLFFIFRILIFNGIPHFETGTLNNVLYKLFNKIIFLVGAYKSILPIIFFIISIMIFIIKIKKSCRLKKILLFLLLWICFAVLPVFNIKINNDIDSIHYLFYISIPFSILFSVFLSNILKVTYHKPLVYFFISFYFILLFFINNNFINFWHNLSLYRNKLAENVKNEISKNKEFSHILFFDDIKTGGFSALIHIDDIIYWHTSNFKKIIYYNFNIKNLDISSLNIDNVKAYYVSNKIYSLGKNEYMSKFYNSTSYKIINNFSTDKNFVLSAKQILHFVNFSDDDIFFERYNPAVIEFLKNNTALSDDLTNNSANFKSFVHFINFIYYDNLNLQYWIELIKKNKMTANDELMFSIIAYYSITLNKKDFHIQNLIELNDIFLNSRISQTLNFFITSILYKNNFINPVNYKKNIPNINLIESVTFKKMILNLAILLSDKHSDYFSKCIPLEYFNFNNLVFYGHYILKNTLYKTGYLNPNSFIGGII
ncbi:hypothetical protein KA977_10475 [Candidatus Dependentiae bacterium]|nr:hypothetical protein [Candidatus Dependentiae bacterium]